MSNGADDSVSSLHTLEPVAPPSEGCIGPDKDTKVGDEVADLNKSDHELMPPPPAPSTDAAVTALDAAVALHKLVKPLEAMRPSKYANVDVVDLFPEFRANKVSVCVEPDDVMKR